MILLLALAAGAQDVRHGCEPNWDAAASISAAAISQVEHLRIRAERDDFTIKARDIMRAASRKYPDTSLQIFSICFCIEKRGEPSRLRVRRAESSIRSWTGL